MPRVEQVHLRLRHVAAVGGRLKSGSYIREEEGRPYSSRSTGASAARASRWKIEMPSTCAVR